MSTRRSLVAATSAGFVSVLALHMATPSTTLAGSAAPTTTTTTSPSSPGTTTIPGGTRTAVGASAQFGYGVLSVKVTAQGRRIVAVSLANSQYAESYSQQLTAQVIPTLTNEVITAQGSNIQSVSGASYTSQGFYQSLQSALSQLGI